MMVSLPTSSRLRVALSIALSAAFAMRATEVFALSPAAARAASHASPLLQQRAVITRPQLRVPSVVGMTVDSATRYLASGGLVAQLVDRLAPAAAAQRVVTAQNPVAGTPIAVNGIVQISTFAPPNRRTGVVTPGGRTLPPRATEIFQPPTRVAQPPTRVPQPDTMPRPAIVPSIVGLRIDRASAVLERARLVLGRVDTVESVDQVDRIITQEPSPQSQVAVGSDVDVAVGQPPRLVQVPNVVDSSSQAAALALRRSRLRGVIAQVIESESAEGIVVAQAPEAASSVRPNSIVRLTITRRPQIPVVIVPNVVGVGISDASRILEDSGLTVGRIVRTASPVIPDTVITRQDPSPGTVVRGKTPVRLFVSVPAPRVSVPDVVGQTEDRARQMVEDEGLRLAVRREVESASSPGTVLAQNPGPGSSVQAGEVIDVDLARAVATVSVPNVVGLPLEAARETLSVRGLRGTVSRTVESATVARGNVMSQNPGRDSEVAPGSSIGLVIASPPAIVRVRVPPVVGLALDNAMRVLRRDSFVISTVDRVASRVRIDTVMSQSPSAGSMVQAGSGVALTIGTRSPTVVVPNVLGRPLTEARAMLRDSGLAAGAVRKSPGGQRDTISSQEPRAGSTVNRGSSVALTLGQGTARVRVPDVVGMTVSGARDTLRRLRLVAGVGAGARDTAIVASQDPDPQGLVEAGASVQLTTQLTTTPTPPPVDSPSLDTTGGPVGTGITITDPDSSRPWWPPPIWSVVAVAGALALLGGGLAMRAKGVRGRTPPADPKPVPAPRPTPATPIPLTPQPSPKAPQLQYAVRMDGLQASAGGGGRSLALPGLQFRAADGLTRFACDAAGPIIKTRRNDD